MFLVLAGDASPFDRMASQLRGGDASPRLWRAIEGGAAALPPFILPEDAFDAQPIVGEERVFVGQVRIDNRDELLAMLDVRDPIADSTLACMAWDRWGEASLRKIVGDFAFVVWHPRERRLIAAVDHHGERRVFWSRVPNGIALSAQMQPLLGHPEISSRPDLSALAQSLEARLDREVTPYAAIRSVPGGQLLEWRDGDVRIRPWWQPDTEPSARGDYVAEVLEVFDRAVRARLRANGTITTTLSGGLDSGLVTATAARELGDCWLVAYTAIPTPGAACAERDGWESDDTPYAAEVAAMYGNIDHRFVSAGGRCVLDLFETFRTPTRHILNLLWLDPMLQLLPAHDSRVLLLGQMGNATISWSGVDDRGFLRRLAGDLRRRVRKRPLTIGASFLRRERRPAARPRPSPFSRESRLEFAMTPHSIWSPDTVAQWGVEWRDPTIDRRVVECLLRFPPRAYRIGGEARGLARAMAKGRLPERVRLRRTRGAQVPEIPTLIAMHAKRYEAALQRMARSEECRELFDFEAMRVALDRITGGALDDSTAIAINRAFDVGLFLCRAEGVA